MQLYYTQDFGQTWNELTTYALDWAWGLDGLQPSSFVTDEMIIVVAFPDKVRCIS